MTALLERHRTATPPTYNLPRDVAFKSFLWDLVAFLPISFVARSSELPTSVRLLGERVHVHRLREGKVVSRPHAHRARV